MPDPCEAPFRVDRGRAVLINAARILNHVLCAGSFACHNRGGILITAWLPLDTSLAAEWLATAGITVPAVTA